MVAKLSREQAGDAAGEDNQGKRQQRRQSNYEGNHGEQAVEPLHTNATAEQIEASPVGTLAHRNYRCKALNDERMKHAPAAMVQAAKDYAGGNLAFERALHPSIAHTVPPPATEATFRWHVAAPGWTFRGKVYTDGSRLDGPTPLLARNGWGFVVLDDDGATIAAASGLPPEWIEDIPGTEAWALTQAAMRAELGCVFFVDCQPCVDAFHDGPEACRADNKPLARVHAVMHVALDDVPKQAVIWMPAHLKPGACGSAIRGEGFLVEEGDVIANDAADKLAKAAVEEHRVPIIIRNAIKEHDELVTDNAMWIARATAISSDQPGEPARDTEASKARAAQAAAERRKAKAAAAHFQPTKRGKETARPKSQGGHTLERHGAGWWCSTCRRKSLTWHKLAPQSCKGDAPNRWSKKASNKTEPTTGGCKRHHVVESKPLL